MDMVVILDVFMITLQYSINKLIIIMIVPR